MTKRLSTRISLRWPPEPPFENTDTLVLSVGNWYVDLRVDRRTATLDWAIAGERLQNANSTLPNGDDLEVGVMPRPDLPGAPMREYEEVWKELPFVRTERHENLSFVLESATGGTQLEEGEEKEVTRTFIGAIWGSYIALRQRQVLARPIGDTKTVIKSGAEVSAKREEFTQGQGFVVKYSLGPEADDLPTHADIRFPPSDGSLERLVVGGQEYVVRSWQKS